MRPDEVFAAYPSRWRDLVRLNAAQPLTVPNRSMPVQPMTLSDGSR